MRPNAPCLTIASLLTIGLVACSPGSEYSEVDDPYELGYSLTSETEPTFHIYFTQAKVAYEIRKLGVWEIVASFPTIGRSRSGFAFNQDGQEVTASFSKLENVEDTCGKTQLYRMVFSYPKANTTQSFDSHVRICTD